MSIEWPEITKDTPLEEVKRIHQMIWDYTIEHGEKPETPYRSDCVLCEYNMCGDGECSKCLAQWPKSQDGTRTCYDENSLYYQWLQELDLERKREFAKQIRDLPFHFELGDSQ